MRVLTWLLLVPLLAYGGVKGYLWYEFKSGVDRVIEQASLFADISYGSIHTSVMGASVGLDEIVIKPRTGSDRFTVAALRFTLPQIVDFFTANEKLGRGELPESLRLSLSKVTVDLDSQSVQALAQMQEQMAQQQTERPPLLLERIEALGCGDIDNFGRKELVAMGYRTVVADLDLAVKFDEASNRFAVDMELKDRDLLRMTVTLGFVLNPAHLDAAAKGAAAPLITELHMVYDDNGYFELRNAFCAQQRGDTVDDYLNANSQQLLQELGGALPAQGVAAYRQFLKAGGRVEMTIAPLEPINPVGLRHYAQKDLVQLLGLSFLVNGTAIDMGMLAAQESPTGEGLKARQPMPEPTAKRVYADPPTRVMSYQKVDRFALDGYVNSEVLVEVQGKGIREGVLERSDGERIYILINLRGGSVTYPVRIADIKSVMVKK